MPNSPKPTDDEYGSGENMDTAGACDPAIKLEQAKQVQDKQEEVDKAEEPMENPLLEHVSDLCYITRLL